MIKKTVFSIVSSLYLSVAVFAGVPVMPPIDIGVPIIHPPIEICRAVNSIWEETYLKCSSADGSIMLDYSLPICGERTQSLIVDGVSLEANDVNLDNLQVVKEATRIFFNGRLVTTDFVANLQSVEGNLKALVLCNQIGAIFDPITPSMYELN